MPHAPILLPIVGLQLLDETERVAASAAKNGFEDVDAVVLLSSHGERSGVYARVAGSLDGFGIPGVVGRRATDPELQSMLAAAWGGRVVGGPVDHGVLVPLLCGVAPDTPVVAATVAEVTGPAPSDVNAMLDDARAFVDALLSVSAHRRIALVASLNTSAALTPRAPLGYRREAVEVESRVLAALETDLGALPELAGDLWACGGSCGAGPLWVFGSVFSGHAATITCYERPFGVGYLVAAVSP